MSVGHLDHTCHVNKKDQDVSASDSYSTVALYKSIYLLTYLQGRVFLHILLL